VTLEEALRRWCDPEAVAQMVWLAKEGYDGPLVMVVPGPETEYARGVMRYREIRTQLEDELIAKLCRGELTAAGYNARATIDSPQIVIPPNRWRRLVPDFERSEARTAEFAVTDIVVFEGWPKDSRTPERTAGKIALARLPEWYRGWVRDNVDQGRIPTRDEEWAAAKAALGPGVPRDAVRALRADSAPTAWRQRGRRKSASRCGGR
jgi:hypothetical protein